MVELKPLTRENLEDAVAVACSGLGRGARVVLDKAITNPILRELSGADAGEVAYVDGRPSGIYAGIVRKLYWKQDCFWGVAGSTICVLPEARRSMAAMELVLKIVSPRFGSKLFFANSSNESGMRINRSLGLAEKGPDSCARKCIAVLRPLSFLMYLVQSKVLGRSGYGRSPATPNGKSYCRKLNFHGVEIRQILAFDADVFDGFWKRYLASNEGLVCSRSARELQWMFGDSLSKNQVFIAGLFRENAMVGYVIFKSDETGRCWSVVDLIVQCNEGSDLQMLLRGGLKLLKRNTAVVHCEISGFAEWIQPVIEAVFPIKRSIGNNRFSWKVHKGSEMDLSLAELNGKHSWFFGPYDGDLCLC